jgi:hypothetical protein
MLCSLALLTACGVSSTSQSDLPTASPTPFSYITPTPEGNLPGPDELLQAAIVAGTATRIWQLTAVPTWPLGATRVYPTEPRSTPSHPFPTRIAGFGMIHETGFTYLPVAYGVFRNQWLAYNDDQVIKVFAGRNSDPRYLEQGLLVVLIEDNNHHTLSGPDTYETSIQAGAVRIADGVGQVLTLEAEDGTLFYFDVQSRRWVSAPTASPPPAISPLPSLTP